MNPIAWIKSKFQPKVITYQLGNGYSAHTNTRPSSGYGSGDKYPQGTSTSNLVITHNHTQLRQKSRDAMYDSSEARSLVKTIADTTVETGLKLKPTPEYDILKITPEQAEEWAENVGRGFHLWAKSKDSHRSGVNNFYQNQHLYETWQQRDNDMFTRFYYSKSPELLNPLQIDFVDPNQINGCGFTSSWNNIPGDDGIIRDSGGKEIGYKIWYFNPTTRGYEPVTIPARGEKSGRIFMIHGYSPEYAGQGRGYPQISHILQDLEKLTDYKVAVIQKAINQASFVFVMENDEKDPSNPMAGRVAGPMRQYGVDGTPPENTATPIDDESPLNYTSIPEATFRSPGINMFNARRGDKLKSVQETSPGPQYEAFTKAFFASLAASVGQSVEFVEKKFGTSYSANQGAIELCYRVARIWRDEMEADFLNPVYHMWLSEEIAAGRISAPGWSDPRLRAAWLSCEWAGAPMLEIDKVKAMNAHKLAVELGAENLDDPARDHNGSSYKANVMKLRQQYTNWPTPPWNEAPAQPEPQPIESDNDEDNQGGNNETGI